jgi:hypothetical protein
MVFGNGKPCSLISLFVVFVAFGQQIRICATGEWQIWLTVSYYLHQKSLC